MALLMEVKLPGSLDNPRVIEVPEIDNRFDISVPDGIEPGVNEVITTIVDDETGERSQSEHYFSIVYAGTLQPRTPRDIVATPTMAKEGLTIFIGMDFSWFGHNYSTEIVLRNEALDFERTQSVDFNFNEMTFDNLPGFGVYEYTVTNFSDKYRGASVIGTVQVSRSAISPRTPGERVTLKSLSSYGLHVQAIANPVSDVRSTHIEIRYSDSLPLDSIAAFTQLTESNWATVGKTLGSFLLSGVGTDVTMDMLLPQSGKYELFARLVDVSGSLGPVNLLGTVAVNRDGTFGMYDMMNDLVTDDAPYTLARSGHSKMGVVHDITRGPLLIVNPYADLADWTQVEIFPRVNPSLGTPNKTQWQAALLNGQLGWPLGSTTIDPGVWVAGNPPVASGTYNSPHYAGPVIDLGEIGDWKIRFFINVVTPDNTGSGGLTSQLGTLPVLGYRSATTRAAVLAMPGFSPTTTNGAEFTLTGQRFIQTTLYSFPRPGFVNYAIDKMYLQYQKS